jgi:hypothetical protein
MYVVNSTRSYERGRERDRGIVEEYTTTLTKTSLLEHFFPLEVCHPVPHNTIHPVCVWTDYLSTCAHWEKRNQGERERRGIPTSQYIIYPCGLLLPHGRQERERERENHSKFPQLHSTS